MLLPVIAGSFVAASCCFVLLLVLFPLLLLLSAGWLFCFINYSFCCFVAPCTAVHMAVAASITANWYYYFLKLPVDCFHLCQLLVYCFCFTHCQLLLFTSDWLLPLLSPPIDHWLLLLLMVIPPSLLHTIAGVGHMLFLSILSPVVCCFSFNKKIMLLWPL